MLFKWAHSPSFFVKLNLNLAELKSAPKISSSRISFSQSLSKELLRLKSHLNIYIQTLKTSSVKTSMLRLWTLHCTNGVHFKGCLNNQSRMYVMYIRLHQKANIVKLRSRFRLGPGPFQVRSMQVQLKAQRPDPGLSLTIRGCVRLSVCQVISSFLN